MPAILTVDDSRAVRTIVGKQVKELGFEVLEAEDGIQGLEVLAQSSVDLVLLDVTMPNMDGPTMLQKMRGTSTSARWAPVAGRPGRICTSSSASQASTRTRSTSPGRPRRRRRSTPARAPASPRRCGRSRPSSTWPRRW